MVGTTLGSYHIVEKLGDGGMGSVYKAIDVMVQREVAIKMLHPELARNPETVERFRSEAIILAKLKHPNISTLYTLFQDGPHICMVMEFVRGQALDQLLKQSGRVSCERAADFGIQALHALEEAHRHNIIHRDLKPANLMLSDLGKIKVMDFGIARMLGTHRHTREGRIIGTLTYMAPEQIRGQEGDARTDVYALGVLMYELITGRIPFADDDEYALMQAHVNDLPMAFRSLSVDVPPLLEEAVMRALSKAPENRFQTAAAFRLALEEGMSRTVANRVPPTRMAESVPSAAAAPVPLGETALASNQGARSQPGPRWMKETRLAEPDVANTKRWFSLTWRQYVGASGLLVTLLLGGMTLGRVWSSAAQNANEDIRKADSVAQPPYQPAVPALTRPEPPREPFTVAPPDPPVKLPVEGPKHVSPPPRPEPPPLPPQPALVRAGSDVEPPQKIKDVKPVYPAVAQLARIQGDVIIEATIGTGGKIEETRILRSIALLDQAALDAVRQWEFTPTLLNGVPVRVILTVTISFTLVGEEQQQLLQAQPPEAETKRFSVTHLHKGWHFDSCDGWLTVAPDGTVRYDCNEPARRKIGSDRCDHVTFFPGSIKAVKKDHAVVSVQGGERLHIAVSKLGDFNFEGEPADIEGAFQAIIASTHKNGR